MENKSALGHPAYNWNQNKKIKNSYIYILPKKKKSNNSYYSKQKKNINRNKNYLQLCKYAQELRARPTQSELEFIKYLHSKKYKYYFQYVFLNTIVDFYLPDLNLMIEIDGKYHKNTIKKDARKDFIRTTYGHNILRLPNWVIEHSEIIEEKIKKSLNKDINLAN